MTYLAYDTETCGLPDFRERSNHPSQPHIVQLALLTFDDEHNEIASDVMIVRPDGWTIPPEMTAIHGISHERAMDEGIPEAYAVGKYVLAQARASVRVAHNASFDTRILRIGMTRAGFERDFIEAIEARPEFCTCNASKRIVNLLPSEKMVARGMTGPKPPKLSEAYRHFFGEELDGAHDALVDARACARIYRRLREMESAAA